MARSGLYVVGGGGPERNTRPLVSVIETRTSVSNLQSLNLRAIAISMCGSGVSGRMRTKVGESVQAIAT